MAAVPIISAAVGVTGTIVNSIQASKNAARNNAAIQQQVAASAQSEAERLANVALQKNFLLQDYILSNYQRRATYVKQMADLENQAQANTLLQAQTEQALSADTATQLSQVRQAQGENNQQYQARLAQADQVRFDGQNAATEAFKSANVDEIIQALQSGDIQAAAALANTDGRSRADQSNAKTLLTPDLIQGFQAIQESGAVSDSAMKEIVMSEQFRGILQKVAEFEKSQGAGALGSMAAGIMDTSNANRKVAGIAFGNTRRQLAGAVGMMPTQMRLDQGQANMNFIAGNQSLDAGGYNVIAQGAAERAQLMANLQQGPSFLSTAAGVAQAALPAVSYFMQQRQSGASAIKQPVPLAVFANRRTPTVGSQFFPKSSMQDVPNPVPVYG